MNLITVEEGLEMLEMDGRQGERSLGRGGRYLS